MAGHFSGKHLFFFNIVMLALFLISDLYVLIIKQPLYYLIQWAKISPIYYAVENKWKKVIFLVVNRESTQQDAVG